MTRLLLVAAALFLVTTGGVLAAGQARQGVHARFDWPDEMANAFFARQIANHARLNVPDPDIALLEQRLHPRSVNVIGSALVPGGFIGLPFYYGTLASIIGFSPTLFLTPVLVAASALILFFGLRNFLHPRHAFFAALVYLFHPAVWYFSAYTYLPNMPFVALLILSLGTLLAIQGKRSRVADALGFLSGAAAGAALAIRPAEGLWAVPLLALAVWPHRHIRSRLVLWVAAAAMFFLPVLALQLRLFGSVFGGYARFDAGGAAPSEAVAGPLAFVLPFGFHPLHALARFWDSFLLPFWWVNVLAVLGIGLACIGAVNEPSRRRRLFGHALLALSAGIVAYLILLYGSWRFADAEIFAVNTIGRSYVRYWLPIAVLSAIAAAAPLARMEGFPELRVRVVGRAITVAMVAGSFLMAFVFPKEALLAVRGRLAHSEAIRIVAAAVLPGDAIILTQRMDKVFFPEYRVIALEGKLFEDDQAMDLVAQFVADRHFFLADILTPDDVGRIKSELAERGVVLQETDESSPAGAMLYQFIPGP